MKAHKVPATYYGGWKIDGFKSSIYVFYKENIVAEGLSKKFKKVETMTKEHSFFMGEDFYIIDFKTKGIVYKLKNEINDFLKLQKYTISCVDTISEDSYADKVIIDSYDNFLRYINDIDSWEILDVNNNKVLPSEFKNDLNIFISETIGRKIEEDYFSKNLEPKWNQIKDSLEDDIRKLSPTDDISITKKDDFLEFVVVQYLRIDDRIEKDIRPTIDFIEKVFKDIGLSDKDLLYFENDGLFSYEPYFYGILLDAARGNKKRILDIISIIEDIYLIDVLEAPKGISYITSTKPLVVSKRVGDKKEEMLFPINKRICARFRMKAHPGEKGKYIKQTIDEAKGINNTIIKETNDIVISDQKFITGMI